MQRLTLPIAQCILLYDAGYALGAQSSSFYDHDLLKVSCLKAKIFRASGRTADVHERLCTSSNLDAANIKESILDLIVVGYKAFKKCWSSTLSHSGQQLYTVHYSDFPFSNAQKCPSVSSAKTNSRKNWFVCQRLLQLRQFTMLNAVTMENSKCVCSVDTADTSYNAYSSHLSTDDTSNPSNNHPESTRQSSLSASTTRSIISPSIIEAKNEHAHTQSAQQDHSIPMSNMVQCRITPETRPPPTFPILLAFIALCLSIFLVALDTVLIPTALPTISLSFHISDSLYAWIGSAYLLSNAASVPFWGKISDIFGRKPVILTANFIFLGGSIICAVSVNAVMLVAGRVVQGCGGGGVVVLVHVCVSDLFSIRYVPLLPVESTHALGWLPLHCITFKPACAY
jgi:hypothetical protein